MRPASASPSPEPPVCTERGAVERAEFVAAKAVAPVASIKVAIDAVRITFFILYFSLCPDCCVMAFSIIH